MAFRDIIKHTLLKEDNLICLLSGAFYGNSWFSGSVPDEYKHLISPQSECREDKWADVLKKGGKICVTDWEDEDEKEYLISLDDIIKAIEKIHDEHLHVYARIMDFKGCEADFYDYDAVIQYAVFGEWVYG